MRAIRGGVSLFSAVKNLRAGNIAGALGAGASMGNPMPVYVVNMGAGGMLADAAGMAMGGGTGKVWQFLKGAGKWGKLAGRAGAGLGMAYGVYEAFTADDKKGIGQGVGTVIGSALGFLGGPIGAAIGGTLGGWAGGWIGGMFDDAEAESKKKYQEYMANQTHITRNNIHFQIDKDGNRTGNCRYYSRFQRAGRQNHVQGMPGFYFRVAKYAGTALKTIGQDEYAPNCQ